METHSTYHDIARHGHSLQYSVCDGALPGGGAPSAAATAAVAERAADIIKVGPGMSCIARMLVTSSKGILSPRFLNSKASYDVASNICHAHCSQSHRHAF